MMINFNWKIEMKSATAIQWWDDLSSRKTKREKFP